MIAEFQFLRPVWLAALLALPLFWLALRADGALQRSWARAVDAHLLRHLLAGSATPRRWPAAVLSLAWTIACLALAGPAWEKLPTPLYRNQAARVIALELSPSMLAADLKPDRLTRARFAIRDLLDALGDGQVALLGYAGDAFVVAPMTDDAATVRNLLGELEPGIMPVGGNRTAVAIRRGVDLIRQSGSSGGELILVCDTVSGDADLAAREAAQQGVHVSVLAVGTAEGAPVSLPQGDFWKDSKGDIVVPRVDAAALRRVAEAGGGRFVALDGGNADLAALRGTAAANPSQSVLPPGADGAQLRDRGPWLALLLLPLALAGFRRGWFVALLLAAGLAPPQSAQAMEWRDLWQRADQQAWQSLQDGDAERAAAVARDPQLRGAAKFRAGDTAGAAADWAPGSSADAAYNFGNALARQQQYEQAIAAWDEALRRDPDHADAKANKQAVEDWLRQQQQQKSTDGKDGSSKDQQDPSGAKPDQPQQGNQDASDAAQQSQDASAGQEGQQRDGKAGQQGEAAQNGQPGAQSQAEDASRAAGETQQGQDQAGRAGKAKPGERDESKADAAEGTQAQANAQQQQAFRDAMEKALREGGQDRNGPDKNGQEQREADRDAREASAARAVAGDAAQGKPGEAAVPAETEAEREQRQAVDQWLQRVPDDPGGLLRRKFQLEYERRQRAAPRGGRE
ncbi:VWA domain-containing protein [Tahibacter sp. UC22_41]|uniref:VWA domain-containing protein n=1 Tax=Tahibacter sp. UC22_41 TaxID=3350178 RepID=UPI0036DB7150